MQLRPFPFPQGKIGWGGLNCEKFDFLRLFLSTEALKSKSEPVRSLLRWISFTMPVS